jgi:hypothetical protein
MKFFLFCFRKNFKVQNFSNTLSHSTKRSNSMFLKLSIYCLLFSEERAFLAPNFSNRSGVSKFLKWLLLTKKETIDRVFVFLKVEKDLSFFLVCLIKKEGSHI